MSSRNSGPPSSRARAGSLSSGSGLIHRSISCCCSEASVMPGYLVSRVHEQCSSSPASGESRTRPPFPSIERSEPDEKPPFPQHRDSPEDETPPFPQHWGKGGRGDRGLV